MKRVAFLGLLAACWLGAGALWAQGLNPGTVPTPGASPTPTPTATAGAGPGSCLNDITNSCKPSAFDGSCPTGSHWDPNPCQGVTPTPTPTPKPSATPTPTPTRPPVGPVPIGFDPYQAIPCFTDALGARITEMGGGGVCQLTATKSWTLASSVEAEAPALPPGTATWVPWGLVNVINVTQVPGPWGSWQANTTTDTISNPCPLSCNGWLWTALMDSTLDDADAPVWTVADDLTLYVQASWMPSGTGKARLIAQLSFNLPDGSGWAELDVNLGMTPTWPHPDTRPGYVSVAPVDVYRQGAGLRYYVVFDGPVLGFDDAGKWGGVMYWRLPISALVRKARTDNPTAFPVPDNAQVSSFGLAREQWGEERQDVQHQAVHLWARGPQAMPAP